MNYNLPPGVSQGSYSDAIVNTCEVPSCGVEWCVAANYELGARFAVNEDTAFICPVCGFDGEVHLIGADLAALRAKYEINSDSIVERILAEYERAMIALAEMQFDE